MKKIYVKPQVEIEQTEDVILFSDQLVDSTGNDNQNWSQIVL
jgi:hypothetical protein